MLGLSPIAGSPIAAFKSSGSKAIDVYAAEYVRFKKKKRQAAEDSKQPAHLIEQVLRKRREEQERKKAAVAQELVHLIPEATALPAETAPPRVWTPEEIEQDDADILALVMAEEEALRNAFTSTLRMMQ